MCTVIALRNNGLYFGRNMDIEYSFGEKVVITPQNFILTTKHAGKIDSHYAMIGMANVTDNYPLYAEAVNEKGLCMAGLNFPDNAYYRNYKDITDKKAIAPYELIPFILGQCCSVSQAVEMLKDIELCNTPFVNNLPLVPLHFIITDNKESVTVEYTIKGLNIYDNPFDVLTNNPPFEFHSHNVSQYRHLSAHNTMGTLGQDALLPAFCEGLGAVGLPGDFSSASRFVKALFCLVNSKCDSDKNSCTTQVMHILDSVSMVSGSVITQQGNNDITRYSCCIDSGELSYCYKTYTNSRITKVQMTANRIKGDKLLIFPLTDGQDILVQ